MYVQEKSRCPTYLPITEHNCHNTAGWHTDRAAYGAAALLRSVAGEQYSCAGAVTVKNTGNVRLSTFVLISTQAAVTFSCDPALTTEVLPEGTITCTATHPVTEGEFEAGKFTLGVAASATASGTNADVTVAEVTHDVTLTKRQEGTIAVTHSAPATPVTGLSEYYLWKMGNTQHAVPSLKMLTAPGLNTVNPTVYCKCTWVGMKIALAEESL